MVFATALAALMAKQSDEALRALDRCPATSSATRGIPAQGVARRLAHAQPAARKPPAPPGRPASPSCAAAWRTPRTTPNSTSGLGELLAWTGQTEPALREARVFEELARTRVDWTASAARIYAALDRADARCRSWKNSSPPPPRAAGRHACTPAARSALGQAPRDPRFQKLCEEPTAKVDEKSVPCSPSRNLSDDKANEYSPTVSARATQRPRESPGP